MAEIRRVIERASDSEKYRIFSVEVHRVWITVTVTSRPSVVRKWIRSIIYFNHYHLNRLVVGLGVQWAPDSMHEDNPAATLQLCVGRRCLVFQLIHSETVPLLLRRFLLNPNIFFVGLWNSRDEDKLLGSKHVLEVHQLVDLRHHAVTAEGEGLARKSVKDIVKEYLGFDGEGPDKSISMSQWNEERLTPLQVWQACYDAFVCFTIGRKMKIWKKIWTVIGVLFGKCSSHHCMHIGKVSFERFWQNTVISFWFSNKLDVFGCREKKVYHTFPD